MNKEQTILSYMKKLGISREEAEQLWEDDQEDYIGEEGEAMTQKAKAIKNIAQSDKPRVKAQKERKIDEPKKFLIEEFLKVLDPVAEITGVQTETEIKFNFNNEPYTLKLTRHRVKKK